MPNTAADVNGLLLRELKDAGAVVQLEFFALGRGGRTAAFRAVVNGLLSREPNDVNAVVLRKLLLDLERGGRAAASESRLTASCRSSPRTQVQWCCHAVSLAAPCHLQNKMGQIQQHLATSSFGTSSRTLWCSSRLSTCW